MAFVGCSCQLTQDGFSMPVEEASITSVMGKKDAPTYGARPYVTHVDRNRNGSAIYSRGKAAPCIKGVFRGHREKIFVAKKERSSEPQTERSKWFSRTRLLWLCIMSSLKIGKYVSDLKRHQLALLLAPRLIDQAATRPLQGDKGQGVVTAKDEVTAPVGSMSK